MRNRWFFVSGIIASSIMFAGSGSAQEFLDSAMRRASSFDLKGGEAVFKNVCQGCHMADAKGALGAGMYPALAKNSKLEVAGYPISVILNGKNGMPPFQDMLSDQQVADVVNYVRTHFGNAYKDKVTSANVKSTRP